ncbi:transglutaminase domain-containing protein [Naumannella sp. ID2617S]|nr:transglutaminase domain-containing protein [Naumannella sp. ID2617S]
MATRSTNGFRLLVSDRYAIAIIIAALLASATLLPLSADRSYLPLAAIGVVALGLVGLVLRRLRLGEGVVLAAEAVVLIGYVFAVSLGLGGDGNPFTRFTSLYAEGVRHIQTQPAPMAPNPGVTLLFVTAVGVIAFLTDVMVQGIDRPMWAIAPLAALFLVPALGLVDQVPVWAFLAIAAGYLGVLLAEGINTSERWPRGVRRSEHDRGSAPLAWQLAVLVGVPAVVLSIALGSIAPTVPFAGWGGSRAKGDGPLQMADPTLDLRRNLNQPEDRQVISYQTDKPQGTYLRMASLPILDNSGWHNAGLQLTTGRDLPPAPGYRSVPGQQTRTTRIQISDFRSEYLPLPFAPDAFEARGDWAYDRDSLVVLATGADRADATRGLQYTVRSIDIEPDGPGLSRAQVSNPPDAPYTVPVPQDVPNDIVNKTIEVTNAAPTPALKAAAIQKYLRSDGGFTYSTEPQPGSGYQALQNFLFRDKKGYCEQFAASMALMARVVGIPSRVAVGFLPGERSGDNYQVSIRDMHAWPELWFEGYGWVRFEPTPNIASAPAWTVQSPSTAGQQPGASATPEPAPSSAPPEEPTPTPEPTPEVAPPPAPTGFAGFLRQNGLYLGAGLGLLILVGALACTPMLLRSRRRKTRLSGSGDLTQQVEAAWAEVRDSVVDLGENWPAGSPRVIGNQVAHGLDPSSAKAMTVLALMVERARYARRHSVNADLSAITHQVRRGLASRVGRGTRVLADWWPRSLFTRWR